MKEGDSVVFSASTVEANPVSLKRKFTDLLARTPEVTNSREQLVRCADTLICNHNNRKKITAGFSWLYTGLLRETLGNGNPLQCSCLENPTDGGAWWAAVYGVTQSWT